MFQSEIRESQINDLFEKVRNRRYRKYLLKIVIDKARSISNKSIEFEFPVTAIVGPNGGGKTTIAGAAAILYREIAPAQFFAKSGKYDASMLNWKIEYEAIDKSVKVNDTVSVSFVQSEPKRLKNDKNESAVARGVMVVE